MHTEFSKRYPFAHLIHRENKTFYFILFTPSKFFKIFSPSKPAETANYTHFTCTLVPCFSSLLGIEAAATVFFQVSIAFSLPPSLYMHFECLVNEFVT